MGKVKIGITQRVDIVKSYNERRDCLDQKWTLFLQEIEIVPVPIPNNLQNVPEWVENNGLKGFVLSGGNDISSLPNAVNIAPERDKTEVAILDYSQKNNLPVIGVCRGFQLMNIYLGGSLNKVFKHTAVRHTVKPTTSKNNFSMKTTEVNSFHNWGIHSGDIALNFESLMIASDATIESAKHSKLNWAGIMWHPEREKVFSNNDLSFFQKILT